MYRISRIFVLLAGLAVTGLLTSVAQAQSWRTMTSSRQVWDRDPIDVSVKYGGGTLQISPADAPTLYHMELRYDEELIKPRVEYDPDDRTLELGVTTGGRSVNIRESSTATIRLTREIPIDLNLEFGAGKAEIELGGMTLERVSLSTGASETVVSFGTPNPIAADRITIEAGAADLRVIGIGNARAKHVSFQGGVGAALLDFSGLSGGENTASVQIGVGALTLRLPRGHGILLNRNSFLTSFNAPGLERRGNSYYSPEWANSPNRLTIDVSAALGSITIEWID